MYFTCLYLRYKSGLVTREMLALDKRGLWAIGACEAVAQLLFMVGAAHLPGVSDHLLCCLIAWLTRAPTLDPRFDL